jgi:hypothetical protein
MYRIRLIPVHPVPNTRPRVLIAARILGDILLRFERSALPEHAGANFLVLRVLKIMEPIKVTIPGYDMRYPLPEEGSLLKTYSRYRLKVWSVDLDDPPKGLEALRLLIG